MKKGIMMLVLSLLFLAGCGKEETTSSSSVESSHSSQSKEKETVEKTTTKKKVEKSEATTSMTSTQITSQTVAATTTPTVDVNTQRCPDYNEMTPEAKAEMERYYDGNNNGIPDREEVPEQYDDYYRNEQGEITGDAYQENLPPADFEEYQGGGDPAVQAETQRLQLEWAEQQGLL